MVERMQFAKQIAWSAESRPFFFFSINAFLFLKKKKRVATVPQDTRLPHPGHEQSLLRKLCERGE